MRKNKITAILTLRDRFQYTKRWLKNNYCENLDYIIADGSVYNQNEKLLKRIKKSNFLFKRFLPDTTAEDFIKKIVTSIKLAKTPFVFLCDNDDFINIKEINKIQNALLEKKADLYGYNLKSVFEKFCEQQRYYRFSASIISGDYKQFSRYKKKERFKYNFKSYNHFWYNILTKEAALKIWSTIKKLKIKDIYALELAHSFLSLAFCHYRYIPICHYIRVINPKASVANKLSKKSSVFESAFNKIQFQKDINKLKIFCAKNKICSVDCFNAGFLELIKNQVMLKNIIKNKIFYFFSKILRKICLKKTVF